MARRYSYYSEPEDTWQSDLFGGLAKGFQTGIEGVMQNKLKAKQKEEEEGRKREEDATKISDENIQRERRRDEKRVFEKGRRTEDREYAAGLLEEKHKRQDLLLKEKISREKKDIEDPVKAAKAKQDLINSIVKGIGDNEIGPQTQQVLDQLENERNALLGIETQLVEPPPPPAEELGDIPRETGFLSPDRPDSIPLAERPPDQGEAPPEPIAGDIPPEGDTGGQGQVLTSERAVEYLEEAKGDKELARRLAVEDGWIIPQTR